MNVHDEYLFEVLNQSPWLVEIYNKYLDYKTDGFLVEIGVGHTLNGIDKIHPDTLNNITNFDRVSSNTADFLDLGWSGIYIDPVKEYCEEAKISHKNNTDRLIIVNEGASDEDDFLKLFLSDSFLPNDAPASGYDWVGRSVKTRPTSKILSDNNCPREIDVMSIDVEGFEDKVIKGIDFEKHTPSMIVVEVNQVDKVVIDYLLPDKYHMIAHDNLNAVWITKDIMK